MIQPAYCHLLAPGLFEAPEPLPERLETPNLDRLLSHARLVRTGGRAFEQTLCMHFGLDVNPLSDLPTGALSLLGDGGCPEDAVWANVAPAQLYPDRDRMLLFPLADNDISTDFVATVRDAFNAHFADYGLELFCPFRDRWYLRFSEEMSATTRTITDASRRSVDPFLPEGADAGKLRAILNEAQMLLHQLSGDINGPDRFNTLWVWGIGRLPEKVVSNFDCVTGEHPLLSGLARSAGVRIEVSRCRDAKTTLMVDSRLLEAVQLGDMEGWLEALESIDSTIAQLLDGADGVKCKNVVLEDDLGHLFRYRRGIKWPFGRRGAFRRRVDARNEQSGAAAVPF